MIDLTYSGYFTGDDGERAIFFCFSNSKHHKGQFEYEIEGKDIKSIDARKAIEKVLGYRFKDEPIGLCTWNDLPGDVRNYWKKKLPPEAIFQLELVS